MSRQNVTCLKCRKTFSSYDPKKNRVCPKCTKSNEGLSHRLSNNYTSRAEVSRSPYRND